MTASHDLVRLTRDRVREPTRQSQSHRARDRATKRQRARDRETGSQSYRARAKTTERDKARATEPETEPQSQRHRAKETESHRQRAIEPESQSACHHQPHCGVSAESCELELAETLDKLDNFLDPAGWDLQIAEIDTKLARCMPGSSAPCSLVCLSLRLAVVYWLTYWLLLNFLGRV